MSNCLRFIISFSFFNILLFLPFFSHAGQFRVIQVYDGDTVKATDNGKDGSGKWLGEIYLEKLNINIAMLDAGLAEVYRGTLPLNLVSNAYRIAEKKAKEDVSGIWVLRDQYFSPWDWREVYGK